MKPSEFIRSTMFPFPVPVSVHCVNVAIRSYRSFMLSVNVYENSRTSILIRSVDMFDCISEWCFKIYLPCPLIRVILKIGIRHYFHKSICHRSNRSILIWWVHHNLKNMVIPKHQPHIRAMQVSVDVAKSCPELLAINVAPLICCISMISMNHWLGKCQFTPDCFDRG